MGLLLPPDQPVIWRGPLVFSAIKQFLKDVQWSDLEFLIVDMPPGTGDAQLTLIQQVPLSGVVMVTTPQEVALADVRSRTDPVSAMPTVINVSSISAEWVSVNRGDYCLTKAALQMATMGVNSACPR